MTRWSFSNAGGDKKDLISTTTGDRKHNLSSQPNGSDDVDVSTSGLPSPPIANGYGNHSNTNDSDEDWENILNTTTTNQNPCISGSSGGVGSSTYDTAYNNYDEDATVSTTGGSHPKVDTTTLTNSSGASEPKVSMSNNFLRDTTNSVSSSTTPIPLPAPASSMLGVGGNSTYMSLRPKSPSPIQASNGYGGWDHGSSNTRIFDPGDIGLHNIGNTCFMNSGLQCLIHSANLVEYFLKTEEIDRTGPPSLSLIQAFQTVMMTAWNGTCKTLFLNEFRSVLGNIHSQFKDGRQHDGQEFLSMLLDTMHEQLKKWKSTVRPRRIANRISETSNHEVSHIDGENSGDAGRSDSKVSSAANRPSVNTFGYKSKFSLLRKPHPFDFDDNDENIKCKVSEPSSSRARVPFNTVGKTSDPRKNLWIKLKEPFVAPTKRPVIKNRKASESFSPPDNCSKRKRLSTENQMDGSQARCSNETIEWTEATPPPEEQNHMDVSISSTSSPTPATNKRLEPIPVNEAEVPPKRRRESQEELSAKVQSYWDQYMVENNTVIASTFQGVFKSTVVCSVCSFVSVIYDPFGCLTLQIPRTVTRSMNVVFMSLRDRRTFKVSVLAKLSDTMSQLKEEVAKNVPPGNSLDLTRINDYVIAEVVNFHVARTLDNAAQIKTLDDMNKNIYMYELNENFDEKYPSESLPTFNNYSTTRFTPTSNKNPVSSTSVSSELSAQTYLTETWETDTDGPPPPPILSVNGDGPMEVATCSAAELPSCSTTDVSNEVSSTIVAMENCETIVSEDCMVCCICQEECSRSELKRHDCGSILCKDCTKRAAQYFENSDENVTRISGGTHLNCPICRAVVAHEKEYVPCCTAGSGPSMLMTSVVFRHDPVSDTNNNSLSTPRLFGTPLAIKIPSTLPAEEFYEFLNSLNPFPDLERKIVKANREGTQCNECLFSIHCKGCEFPSEGEVSLSKNCSIAICYTNITEEQITSIEPIGMALSSKSNFTFSAGYLDTEPPVDIDSCFRTFSESEILDDPWFCPTCEKNQCASQTLTVARFPDYLIVCLKRFIFADNTTIKLNNNIRFPLNDFDLRPYIAPECANGPILYDLYSFICHYGTASAGHYTAFGKNPVTNKWRYFNDSVVSDNQPNETDFTAAYVLFYQRKGMHHDIPKVKRSVVPYNIPRPVGMASPISSRKYSNDGGNRPDSSGGGSRGHTPNGGGDGHQQVRIVDENTIGELSLSAGNTRLKDPTHPHFSSTRHDFTSARATRVTPESMSQERLSDEEE